MEIKIGSLTQWWFFSNAFSSINEFSWIKFIGLVLYRPTNWAEFVKRWRLKFNISISVSRKRETKKCSTVSIYVQMFGNVIYFVFILHCFESVNVIIWPSTQSCWLMYLSASSKLFQLNQNHNPFKAPIARCMYENPQLKMPRSSFYTKCHLLSSGRNAHQKCVFAYIYI